MTVYTKLDIYRLTTSGIERRQGETPAITNPPAVSVSVVEGVDRWVVPGEDVDARVCGFAEEFAIWCPNTATRASPTMRIGNWSKPRQPRAD